MRCALPRRSAPEGKIGDEKDLTKLTGRGRIETMEEKDGLSIPRYSSVTTKRL